MADSFKFELVSPERLLMSEDVTAVVVPGTEGYLTVMAGHAPLMTTLKPGVVEATTSGGAQRRIYVRGGFADISMQGFTLLAETATPVEDLKPEDLDQQIRNAEEDVADADTPEKRSHAEAQLGQLRDARAAIGM
ncbi:F0F1 ATP synthase subunit epsilon [Mangrovibrevibacter kandeliae]|uniref:F0F1 ATP synthase subunit epsilon n=1 Tax=Mangrovibrevibacter kandeliae TaxID=2968473 RepID=UPI002118777B|nr:MULTISPECIES: F0F1 ATP synthase subunit epsilon [unclassified Aurantimonas]MCQ8783038.1 F0F1 ATP synthase subunit epsilon [Aurantimonas sp. CSK15Z-1]MCW4115770.1 F0F1 ATP synthase subunit epsilon [Aurantimonas sp. MSK8Z-1]